MQSSNQPEKISLPFATSGQKQPIPVASQIGIEDGRASYSDGFPPLTRTPLAAGGVPPFGTDMNGILNAITLIQQWQSAGGMFMFDAVFAAAIGGYAKGAFILKADASGFWQSTIESNTNNPDTGGAGWADFSVAGLIPAGAVQAFAMNVVPAGWLASQGQAVSRATYGRLFAAIGTTYGAGNGTTTFNLPDLRGEVVRGVDNSRGVDPGRIFGSSQGHALQTHNHFLPTSTADAGTTWVIPDPVWQQTRANNAPVVGQPAATTMNTNDGPGNMGTFASETRMRNVALLYCIKF